MKIRLSMLQRPRTTGDRDYPSADLIVFPELVDGGYAALAAGHATHRPGDEYLSSFSRRTAHNDVAIVVGSVRLKNHRGDCTNTSLTYQHGKCIHRYDKIHLFRPTGDHKYFKPGRKADAFWVSFGPKRIRIGIALCFDLRFPELIRALAFQRMDLLIVPARWPSIRSEAWKTLLRARAIENQVFVAGCNAVGPEGGPSFVFGPTGAPIPAFVRGAGSTGRSYTLDFDESVRARQLYNSLREAKWFGRK